MASLGEMAPRVYSIRDTLNTTDKQNKCTDQLFTALINAGTYISWGGLSIVNSLIYLFLLSKNMTKYGNNYVSVRLALCLITVWTVISSINLQTFTSTVNDLSEGDQSCYKKKWSVDVVSGDDMQKTLKELDVTYLNDVYTQLAGSVLMPRVFLLAIIFGEYILFAGSVIIDAFNRNQKTFAGNDKFLVSWPEELSEDQKLLLPAVSATLGYDQYHT